MKRRQAFLTVLFLGLALTIFGALFLAPFGGDSADDTDPGIPFAPTFVVLGITLMFTSAVVYELFPGHEEDDQS